MVSSNYRIWNFELRIIRERKNGGKRSVRPPSERAKRHLRGEKGVAELSFQRYTIYEFWDKFEFIKYRTRVATRNLAHSLQNLKVNISIQKLF